VAVSPAINRTGKSFPHLECSKDETIFFGFIFSFIYTQLIEIWKVTLEDAVAPDAA